MWVCLFSYAVYSTKKQGLEKQHVCIAHKKKGTDVRFEICISFPSQISQTGWFLRLLSAKYRIFTQKF